MFGDARSFDRNSATGLRAAFALEFLNAKEHLAPGPQFPARGGTPAQLTLPSGIQRLSRDLDFLGFGTGGAASAGGSRSAGGGTAADGAASVDGGISAGGGARRMSEDAAGYAATFDEGLKSVARQIDDVLQRHRSIVDWHLNHDVQREMRRDIKRLLRGTRPADEAQLDELARRVVEVARTRLA